MNCKAPERNEIEIERARIMKKIDDAGKEFDRLMQKAVSNLEKRRLAHESTS